MKNRIITCPHYLLKISICFVYSWKKCYFYPVLCLLFDMNLLVYLLKRDDYRIFKDLYDCYFGLTLTDSLLKIWPISIVQTIQEVYYILEKSLLKGWHIFKIWSLHIEGKIIFLPLYNEKHKKICWKSGHTKFILNWKVF